MIHDFVKSSKDMNLLYYVSDMKNGQHWYHHIISECADVHHIRYVEFALLGCIHNKLIIVPPVSH